MLIWHPSMSTAVSWVVVIGCGWPVGVSCRRRRGGGSRPGRGVVADLDDGHDVQGPVDAPIAGAGEAVAFLVAGGGVRGAVPFQEANLARVAKRATSPTSPRIRAAPAGPMPLSSIRPVGKATLRDGSPGRWQSVNGVSQERRL